MENIEVISRVTELFAEKIGTVNNKLKNKMTILIDEESDKKKSSEYIQIVMLGVESNYGQNMCNKIQLKETDENGTLIEYHTDPPTLIDLKYAVIPNCTSQLKSMQVLGALIQVMKDDGKIEVEGFDWHENNGNPVRINEMPEMRLEKQMQLLNALGLEYKPSLFYQLTVGINSQRKEVFRRVEERKMETVKKKD